MADICITRDLFRLIEAVVTCSACNQLYRSPRVLPSCFHTFCFDCIKQSCTHNDGQDCKDVFYIKCPRCSALHSTENFDLLMKNYLVEKLLEIAAYIRSIDCAIIRRDIVFDFIRRVRDVTECPVCREVFTEPRLLPCIHTFCISCLKRSLTNNWWNPSSCPLCRQQFMVLNGELSSLPRNDILDRILCKMSEPEVQQLVTVVVDPDSVPESQREVTGVAELGGYTYVLISQSNLIRVFISEPPFAIVATVNLDPKIIPCDLTSSKLDRCLFISDVEGLGSIWRVQIEEKVVDYVVHPVIPAAGRNDETREGEPEVNAVPTPLPLTASNDDASELAREENVSASTEATSERPFESETPRSSCISDFLARFVAVTRNRTPSSVPSPSGLPAVNDASPEQHSGAFMQDHVVDIANSTPSNTAAEFEGNPEAFQRFVEAVVARKFANSGGFRQTIIQHHVELWIEDVKSISASVGPNHQLVLITDSGDLHVYNSFSRQLMARYVLPEEVQRPRHAVINYKTGNFIVSHSTIDGSMHRVSELKRNDATNRLEVLHSYGSTPGQTVGHLLWPRHLAADERGFIFVADCGNNRVLLFDENLNIRRVMLSHGDNLDRPWRLCLVPEHGLLVVGSVTGAIQIYSIERKGKRK